MGSNDYLNYYMKKIILLLSLFIFACDEEPIVSDITDESVDLQTGFLPLWQLYIDSSDGGWSNNDLGRFAWDDTYAIDGLIRLYDKTLDVFYLDLAINLIDKIYENTDEKRGIEDVYRDNRSVALWSSTRYTDGDYHAYNVHAGFIIYVGAKIASAIQNSDLPESYIVKGQELTEKLKNSFSFIESDWNALGYFDEPIVSDYDFISTRTIPPINMIRLCGLATLELYKLTGDLKYYGYAESTANYLSQFLYLSDDEAYIWPYGPPITFNEDGSILGPDDTSHGSKFIWFVWECYKENIVFNSQDIEYFSNSFINNMYIDVNQFKRYVDPKYTQTTETISFVYMILNSSDVDEILLEHYNTRSIEYDSESFLNHFGSILIQAYSFVTI